MCLCYFHNRSRLIHHLRQSCYVCLMQYEAHAFALSPDVISVLDAEDRTFVAAQKSAGTFKLHVGQPVFTMVGPKRP